jgi:hypothetical protein
MEDFKKFIKEHIINIKDVTSEFLNIRDNERIIEIEVDDVLKRFLGKHKNKFYIRYFKDSENETLITNTIREIIEKV